MMTDARQTQRLGFLVPARNVTCEYEYPRAVPEGVSCHFSRLARAQSALTADSLIEMMDAAEDAGALLAGTGVSVVGAACTAGSFLDGRDAGQVLAEKASKGAGGVPAFTTTQAVEAAFTALGAKTLFMLTPYPHAITETEQDYFEARGYGFSGTDTFDCQRSEDIRALTSADVSARLEGNRAAIERADAVFVSCTNLATMDRLEAMAATLGRPVLSSNSATLWHALGIAGVNADTDRLIGARSAA